MKYLILLFFFTTLLFSCSKNSQESIESNPIPETVYKLVKIPPFGVSVTNKSLYANIDSLLTNPLDADDTKLNYYMYEIALATKDLIKDPAFN